MMIGDPPSRATVHPMDVTAADAAGFDTNQNIFGSDVWIGYLLVLKAVVLL